MPRCLSLPGFQRRHVLQAKDRVSMVEPFFRMELPGWSAPPKHAPLGVGMRKQHPAHAAVHQRHGTHGTRLVQHVGIKTGAQIGAGVPVGCTIIRDLLENRVDLIEEALISGSGKEACIPDNHKPTTSMYARVWWLTCVCLCGLLPLEAAPRSSCVDCHHDRVAQRVGWVVHALTHHRAWQVVSSMYLYMHTKDKPVAGSTMHAALTQPVSRHVLWRVCSTYSAVSASCALSMDAGGGGGRTLSETGQCWDHAALSDLVVGG